MPAASSAATSAAPAIVPTLNMPCNWLITGRPPSDSMTVPSALMATSNRLMPAPKSSITATSVTQPGAGSTAAMPTPIANPAPALARRTPRRSIARPAKNSVDTAPTAPASSTSASEASSSPCRSFTVGMWAPQAPASRPSAPNCTRVAMSDRASATRRFSSPWGSVGGVVMVGKPGVCLGCSAEQPLVRCGPEIIEGLRPRRVCGFTGAVPPAGIGPRPA